MDRKHALMCIEMTKAIQEKNCRAVSKLLDEERFDVDSELMPHKYPITVSIESNAIAIGKLLISRGCSLSLKNRQGLTPLLLAVQLLNHDFVKLLLDNRADLTSQDNEGRTALHLAAEMSALNMTKLLMRHSPDALLKMCDKEGRTAFSYACEHGGKPLLSCFLERGGSEVNRACGAYGNTPLHTLLSNYCCTLAAVTRLLDAGANINHPNKLGETPLLKAFHNIEFNHKAFHDVCALLVTRGGEVNARDSLGNTPLHMAAKTNDLPLVRALLNAGSSVDATNNRGLTPLFYACEWGRQEIAAMLLDSGANVKVMERLCRRFIMMNNENTISILKYIFGKSRECRDLRSLCRLVIRENLNGSIDKSAALLPLPPSLVKFILLR